MGHCEKRSYERRGNLIPLVIPVKMGIQTLDHPVKSRSQRDPADRMMTGEGLRLPRRPFGTVRNDWFVSKTGQVEKGIRL
jgi:hypothetical protein